MATYKHLRSGTANKRPTTSIADGQLAINTNTASPGLFFKDSAGTGIVKVGPVHVGTTAPNSVPAAGGSSGNYLGEQWLDTSVSPAQMKVWNGSTWVGIVADELPVSKLQDGAPRQLIQTDAAGTGVEWTSNVDVPGTLDVTSTATFDSIAQYPLGSAGAPTITFTGDNNTGIYSPGADQVAISTGGSGRLFVDASGRVGVGDTPTSLLDISSTSEFTLGLLARTSSTQTSIGSHPIATFTNTSTASGNGVGARFNIADTSGTARVAAQIGAIATAKTASSVTADIYFAPGAQERARIDSSGRLLVGTTSRRRVGTAFDPVGGVFYEGSGAAAYEAFTAAVNRSDNIAAVFAFGKSRGTTNGSNTIVVNGDELGVIRFAGADGTDLESLGAEIKAEVDGTPGANDMPGRLVFSTTADGASSPTERMRITSAGNVGIGTTSPTHSLDVNSAIRLRGAGASTEEGDLHLYYVSDSNRATVTSSTNGAIVFENGIGAVSERARIDSSGRLLVGTSASVWGGGIESMRTTGLQYVGGRFSADNFPAEITVLKSRGASVGTNTIVQNNDVLGNINFLGADGTTYLTAVQISAQVDGTPGTNDMPSRLVFSTTADGASSPTERMRITNDGVQAYNQPAPAAVNATATLTVANLKAGIITSTSAAATDMTLPTGTDTQAGFSGTYDNFTFEWSVINTGPSLVRVLAATAHTIIGSGSVATGTSGRFASRRTAANTFVTYRLS